MNPTAEQIASIYDFQGILELALKTLFTLREVKAFTSQMTPSTGDPAADQALIDEGWDILDFQKDRPRVEIIFTPGAGQGQFRATTIAGLEKQVSIDTSFKGQFRLDVFTLPDIAVHKAFVTAVRFIMHTQLLTLNGTTLLRHRIQPDLMDAGTTPITKAEQGTFSTTLLFDVDFSIQDDAWEQLNQPN